MLRAVFVDPHEIAKDPSKKADQTFGSCREALTPWIEARLGGASPLARVEIYEQGESLVEVISKTPKIPK